MYSYFLDLVIQVASCW